MTFTEFIAKLSSVLREGTSTAIFTRTIFKAILPEGKQDILTYSDSTYKMLYSGKVSIHQISKKISAHIDFMEFSEFIRQYPDSAIETLCELFSEDIPDITPYNAGDKLGQLFVSIITEAAGAKNNIASNASPTKVEQESAMPAAQGLAQYISKATAFYSDVKTLLYTDQPRKFRDFYVCNDLKTKSWNQRSARTVSNVTVDELRSILSRVIISGTGGIGKTMMMRHLLFDCADRYADTGVVPILLLLRNYKDTYTNLADVLYASVTEFTNDVSREAFDALLAAGNCVILLDGLDETVGTTRAVFLEALTNFIKKYLNNMIVVTSRPTTAFVQMRHFAILDIEPFTKEQSIALVDKLEFYDEEVKEAFKQDLDKRLYYSHRQFAGNPLLLTIMLMTYDSYGDIPAKRHVFYRKAYETMARLHDTTKGSYVRPMHTRLEPDDFAVYFAEFCARTYKDGALEFTEKEFCAYMDKVIEKKANSCKDAIAISGKDFLRDLTDNLCILYQEGEQYYFIHRSFQEYFCAVFFANQMDDKLGKIGNMFETQKNRVIGDHTFDMLYDMIPDKMDRYVLLPHLQQLWKQLETAGGYQGFLQSMYPYIHINQHQVGMYYENVPQSFLYSFIINEQGFRGNGQLDDLSWPSAIEYCHCDRTDWVTVTTAYIDADGETQYEQETTTYNKWKLRSRPWYTYDGKQHGDPEIEGTNLTIDLEEMYDYRDKYIDIITFIEADTFPLKQEYNQISRYIIQLEQRHNHTTNSGDWFADF